jgi:hypothetical protein
MDASNRGTHATIPVPAGMPAIAGTLAKLEKPASNSRNTRAAIRTSEKVRLKNSQ